MRDGPLVGTTDGAIEFRPRSVDGFLADLVTARGVITGGGFSLLSEAVYLGKPVLSVPLRGQFEQLMNARYLEREGYGLCAPAVDTPVLEAFLERLDGFHERLEGYVQDGNVEALDGDRGARGGGRRGHAPRARPRAPGGAAEGDVVNDAAKARDRRRRARRRGRGHRGLPGPVPDRAALRGDDPPRARGGQAASR